MASYYHQFSNFHFDECMANNLKTMSEDMEVPLGDGFTIYSGGALGSDSVAEFAARELGMNLEIKIPPTHARNQTITSLTPQELDEANPYMERAAHILKRSCQFHGYKYNLLRRNFHIVWDAMDVYAFGRFETSRSTTAELQTLKGGTGWSVQLAIELCKETGRAPITYVYDTYHQAWFECVRELDNTFVFRRIYKKPYLLSQSAVVGSRHIEDKTGKEIFALFERTADHVITHRKSMQQLTKQMEACHLSPLASHPNQSESEVKTSPWSSE